jgi:hypothetical protein
MHAHPTLRIASSAASRACLSVAIAVVIFLLPGRDAWPQASVLEALGKKTARELKERPPGREGYGEHYDLAKYEECHKKDPRNSRCEIYRLKRIPAPEYWPYHDKSPMKWPDPPKEQVYKPGMGPIEYWRALCKAEAGEFIYRTVPNVEAIYQIRPRPKESSYSASDRYVREDPYGYIESESGTVDNIPGMVLGPGWGSKLSPGGYSNFETVPLLNDIPSSQQKFYSLDLFKAIPAGNPYQRFYGYDRSNARTMRVDYTSTLRSAYGWTWRGIKRPLDREIGVAGGELAIVDLASGEILGLKRGFILGAQQIQGPLNWGGGAACPEYSQIQGIGKIRGRNKDIDFSLWFINKVLLPIGSQVK